LAASGKSQAAIRDGEDDLSTPSRTFEIPVVASVVRIDTFDPVVRPWPLKDFQVGMNRENLEVHARYPEAPPPDFSVRQAASDGERATEQLHGLRDRFVRDAADRKHVVAHPLHRLSK